MYRNNIAQALQRGGAPERLSVARVTANFFDVLRVRPAAGRLFGPEHDVAGGDAVIVLSHALWLRAFAADPNAIGQTVTLGNTPRQIVGILEPGVGYPVGLEPATDAYIPTVATAAERSDDAPGRTYNAYVVGRLRPGATVAQAQQQVDAINVARQYGDKAADRIHVPQPLLDYVLGPAKSWLLLVLAGVGCVLLVACVNVASLFLARATVRMRELATREALGASRRRIAATLLLEGLLLSVASGLAGIGLAFWAIGIVKAALPEGLARASMIALDARVLAVSRLVVIVCGIAFASAPAWLASRVDLVCGHSLRQWQRHRRPRSRPLAAGVPDRRDGIRQCAARRDRARGDELRADHDVRSRLRPAQRDGVRRCRNQCARCRESGSAGEAAAVFRPICCNESGRCPASRARR